MLQNDMNRVYLENPMKNEISIGWSSLCEQLYLRMKKIKRSMAVALDGYLGVDWDRLTEFAKVLGDLGIDYEISDCSNLWKNPKDIWRLIRENIECDVHFGKVFNGSLEDFLHLGKIEKLKKQVSSLRRQKGLKLVIFYGNGIVNKFTRSLFDIILYSDISRNEFLRKIEKHAHRFLPDTRGITKGQADVGLSLATFKLSQYVCTPVFDKHKRQLIRYMDYYAVFEDEIKIISKQAFQSICEQLSSRPFKLLPLYIPGPWGGQWIKTVRNLDSSYPNCAWAFEAVTGDMCLGVTIDESLNFELPFMTFLSCSKERILGTKIFRRFGYFFPIRVHYDDSYEGGNMAIQVHPDQNYVKKNFNERVGQHEAYYIIKRKDGAGVYLGLREKIDVDEFARCAQESHENKTPLDYERYVNFIKSKEGDLFLIPAGTIHALGKDQVCIEIGTSYGYTFHVYDYLRPNLNGELREIHTKHAFAALKRSRRENFVRRSLVAVPKVLRSQGESKEYLLGRKRGMIFEVRRLELEPGYWQDNTGGSFHVLTLINGEKIEILLNNSPEKFELEWSRTAVIPANVGKYTIKSNHRAQILKIVPQDNQRS